MIYFASALVCTRLSARRGLLLCERKNTDFQWSCSIVAYCAPRELPRAAARAAPPITPRLLPPANPRVATTTSVPRAECRSSPRRPPRSRGDRRRQPCRCRSQDAHPAACLGTRCGREPFRRSRAAPAWPPPPQRPAAECLRHVRQNEVRVLAGHLEDSEARTRSAERRARPARARRA